MLAHGFKIELLVELVRAGLATASTERMLASGRPMEITRLRITGAGRRALAQVRSSSAQLTLMRRLER
jgi:hypothetical protein